MMVTSKAEDADVVDDSATAAVQEVAVAPRIERRGMKPGGQLLLKCDEPAVIAVDVTGHPTPDVRWHVAGRRVRKSERYRAAASGRRHTLTVLRVTDELQKGVWVLATNSAGEDSCLITVKTYKVLSGLPNTFNDSIQNAQRSIVTLSRTATQQSAERPVSPETRDLNVTSPTTTTTNWHKEMEIRNRMRSVDDLMYYGRWKRESLQMHSAHRRNEDRVDRGYTGGGNVSLNQSYSCESTLTATAATDDEARPGHTQRKRRTLRVRRRAGSIVSAPTTRRINLDDSIGSAALDVDSMFRFFAPSASTQVAADDGIRRPPLKQGLPPSGRPPSGAAGRTTSARRISHRRRRRPSSSMTDVTNGSVDAVSFDEVQRTSSTVDLKDAMAVVVVASTTESENSSVEQPKPVRSLRRRRRTSESPSPTSTQDSTEAAAPATSTSVAPDNVTVVSKPEVLWELCGEKLNELCRRILDIGVANTDDVVTELTSPDNVAESGRSEVETIQPTDVDEGPLPASEERRTKGVFYSVDLTAYRLSPVHHVVPDLSQPTSQSWNATDGMKGNYTCVENDVTGTDADANGDVTVHRDNDDLGDDLGHKSTSMAVTGDDVYRPGSEETAVNHVLPSDGDHDVEDTETHSPEHCHGGIEPAEATVSDQSGTVGTPPTTGKNHDVLVVDVNEDGASSAIEERRCSPALDINAMLSPSIGLQDILDTIYTLTGGVSVEQRTTDKDVSASLSPRTLPPENPAENGRVTTGDDCRQLPDNTDDVHSAAVCLDRPDDDDDDENSLDLDTEMYDYDLPPAATELADSLHLAIAEDDDLDLDIDDYEYDLDDGDVL